MKAISILGTTSNAGKSWVATALCAWLKNQGVRVAPFKGQNMSNNAYATLEGGEIGIAQAIQAEACGLRPVAEMNPILLKPSSDGASQIIRLGEAGPHLKARDYYQSIQENWGIVASTLDNWKDKCDVLVMEGAGSPVELNLLEKDIANLRPIEYVNGKWILVGDIERGGVFAQLIGTWNLMQVEDQKRGIGCIANRFRGDPELFKDARGHFAKHMELPYLGLLPLREDLYIENEDSFSVNPENKSDSQLPFIAWIKYPRVSNTQDQLPWTLDKGVASRWVESPQELEKASAIILPGSKETLDDLQWIRMRGLDNVIIKKAQKGIPVVGICGGYQMLGQSIHDSANSGAAIPGLGLLPIATEFATEKTVVRRRALYQNYFWETYEIHMGISRHLENETRVPLLKILLDENTTANEGHLKGNVWGTYLHGIFESPVMRNRLVNASKIAGVKISAHSWKKKKSEIYDTMGSFVEENLNLQRVKAYLGI
ncbi:cobyric acid synthase [Puniceicoccaceae bacterium K14]|nr:cobyric acid synthase [Puniceicoccaceae bacterium K14]